MRIKISDIPESLVQQYNIEAKATRDGYARVDINRGMYGLLQVGLISQQLLEKILNKKGYTQSGTTPGFWTHDWHQIYFTPCVNDFGVRYVRKQHADHLIKVLIEHYKI